MLTIINTNCCDPLLALDNTIPPYVHVCIACPFSSPEHHNYDYWANFTWFISPSAWLLAVNRHPVFCTYHKNLWKWWYVLVPSMNSTVKRSILVDSSFPCVLQQGERQIISVRLDGDLIPYVVIVRFVRYYYVMAFLVRNHKLYSMDVWLRSG